MNRATSRAGLVIALLAILGCGAAREPQASTASTPEPSAMPSSDARTVEVTDEGAALEVEFDYAASARALKVSYRLRNTGSTALAAFDRGNRHAVMAKRQSAGSIGAPTFEQAGGDVTLSHRALPLPTPTPTVAPVPLAVRVEPGAELRGAFEFALPTMEAPKRLRWCLGVASFDEADFTAPEQAQGVEVWRASFAVADHQRLLCTLWYDVAAGRFESEAGQQ